MYLCELEQCNCIPESKTFHPYMLLALVNFKLELYLVKPVFVLMSHFMCYTLQFNQTALFLYEQNVQSIGKYFLGFFWLK